MAQKTSSVSKTINSFPKNRKKNSSVVKKRSTASASTAGKNRKTQPVKKTLKTVLKKKANSNFENCIADIIDFFPDATFVTNN